MGADNLRLAEPVGPVYLVAMAEPVIVERGSILCYRIFDIAEELDLGRAEQILSEDARRLKLTREGSQYLQLPNPPVTVELGRRALRLGGGETTVDAVARI